MFKEVHLFKLEEDQEYVRKESLLSNTGCILPNSDIYRYHKGKIQRRVARYDWRASHIDINILLEQPFIPVIVLLNMNSIPPFTKVYFNDRPAYFSEVDENHKIWISYKDEWTYEANACVSVGPGDTLRLAEPGRADANWYTIEPWKECEWRAKKSSN